MEKLFKSIIIIYLSIMGLFFKGFIKLSYIFFEILIGIMKGIFEEDEEE